MLLGALGCNVAWGFIDGVLYLMAILSEQGHNLILLRELRRSSDPVEARRIVASALPELLVSVLPPAQLDVMWHKLNELPDLPTILFRGFIRPLPFN
jgi:hypothetical protein